MTATSRFGTSKRERHDASAFYGRGLAHAELSDDADVVELPSDVRDRVFEHTAEDVSELPDRSVALVVTSPP